MLPYAHVRGDPIAGQPGGATRFPDTVVLSDAAVDPYLTHVGTIKDSARPIRVTVALLGLGARRRTCR